MTSPPEKAYHCYDWGGLSWWRLAEFGLAAVGRGNVTALASLARAKAAGRTPPPVMGILLHENPPPLGLDHLPAQARTDLAPLLEQCLESGLRFACATALRLLGDASAVTAWLGDDSGEVFLWLHWHRLPDPVTGRGGAREIDGGLVSVRPDGRVMATRCRRDDELPRRWSGSGSDVRLLPRRGTGVVQMLEIHRRRIAAGAGAAGVTAQRCVDAMSADRHRDQDRLVEIGLLRPLTPAEEQAIRAGAAGVPVAPDDNPDDNPFSAPRSD